MAKIVKKETNKAPVAPKEVLTQAEKNDIADVPMKFISDTPDKVVKIPSFRAGEAYLRVPIFARFKEYKFETKSKYTASVLRTHCSPTGILELKG